MAFNDKGYRVALERIEQARKWWSLHLSLQGLGLKSLPSVIGTPRNLITLDLRNNQLTTLPLEIGLLTKLQTLNLSSNRLTALPPEIGQLTNLTTLYLDGNQLTALPPEIGQLTNLTTLYLDGNQLTALPPEFKSLTKLRRLELDKERIETPPFVIIEQGSEAIKTYFENIENQETTQLFEAKLLIVGQGGVGKTYLLNRLMYDAIHPELITTEGIDINRWTIQTKQADRFRVNFWDFGGQEIYHATHQFFLTKRSLYLFVWEARTDVELLSFDYWLNTIKVLSDNSPVIVIQNKIDERNKPINQENWKKRFPNIVDYHNVSALEGTGTESLKQVIIQNIEMLPHIGDLLPKRWIDIRQKLEGLDENFISYSLYQEICASFEMEDVQSDQLSEYYHDLGVFLHFWHNPILRNTIFLKPEWATNAVYKVIENQEVKDNYGKFHFNDLGEIWQDRKAFPPEKYAELVELMKSFELCFELPTGQEYIIPELLRANQPDSVADWNYTQNLRFKYAYDFMPAGVMTRFIVRSHDMIKGDLYWKDGVVLFWENTEALIVKTDNRVIEVWIAGGDKKTLLGMIRRDMDYINSPFSNLEVSEMVPCLCSKCRNNPEPHFYPYHILLEASKEIPNIQCRKSFKMVPIAQLWGGIGPKATPQAIKIFLASSGELADERRQMRSFIGQENSNLHSQNMFLDLVIWEEKKKTFHESRFQDRLNELLLECDVAIFLFFKKVGPFTKEEYDAAFEHFEAGNKPRHILVFFKSGEVNIDELDPAELKKIQDLKKEIEDAGQIYARFDSNDNLMLQLKHQLALIIPEIVS